MRTTPSCLAILGILSLAGCGDAPRPAGQREPVPATLEGMPANAPTTTSAADQSPSAAVSERFAQERDGWRVSFALELPVLPANSAKRIRRASEAWLFQGLAEARGDVAATGAAALDRLINDVPATGAGTPWWSERSVITGRIAAGWLSLTRNWSEFSGGAHPNTLVEGLIIDVAEARALTIDEIVPLERQPALRAVLAASLRTQRGLAAGAPLTSEVQDDASLPIPVPSLNADGATFVWNPYEIAAYSEGRFQVVLPAAEVRGLLARDPWAP